MLEWYLVNTKPGQEPRAKFNLDDQNIENYLPMVKVEALDVPIVVEPAFPNYLFAHFDPHETSVSVINNTRGVRKVIAFGNALTKVPAIMVTRLKERFDVDKIISLIPKKGDHVLIKDGSMEGLQAIYIEPDKHMRSYLLIDLLGKLQRVRINNTQFEKVNKGDE